MAEYIERETAIKNIKEHQCRNCSDIGLCENCAVLTAIKLFENIPAVDVQPVKHGRWIDGDCRCVTAVCSNCNRLRLGNGAKSAMRLALYCEKCGARMDGET